MIRRIAELVRAEVRPVIVERGPHRGQHLRHVPVVPRGIEDRQLDPVVLLRSDFVVRRLDREEVEDRRAGDEGRGSAAVAGDVGHAGPGRDRGLAGGRREPDPSP